VTRRILRTPRLPALAAALCVPAILAACSAGDLGSSQEGAEGATSITFLVDNGTFTVAGAQGLVDEFNSQQDDVVVKLDTRPSGGDGDNLVKTRLQTGTMSDVFAYNAGSLFQQLSPESTLQPLTDDPVLDKVDDSFEEQVSVGDEVYGIPYGTSFGGGILYNRNVYADLDLQVPTTWDEFVANSEKIKAAGDVAPVVATFGETWTSQLFILSDFHNVAAENPDWAQEYTAGEAKYATDPDAMAGFEHLQEVYDKDLLNDDFASARNEDGIRMLLEGTGAQFPNLSNSVATVLSLDPEKIDDIGFFATPGSDAETNGLTSWFPGGVYVPQTTTGDKLEAAKAFIDFIATPQACDILSEQNTPTGPYLIDGCTLPDDVPQVTKDVNAYFEDGRQSPALEYLSPVKGPALEQIAVEVGSGIRDAADGAKLYDEDVKKQAQQLGLEGW